MWVRWAWVSLPYKNPAQAHHQPVYSSLRQRQVVGRVVCLVVVVVEPRVLSVALVSRDSLW